MKVSSLRLSPDLLDRAERLVPLVRTDPLVRVGGDVKRSTVLRLALELGLAALEARQPPESAMEGPDGTA